MNARILVGDVRERLSEIPDKSVRCVVTSPPYWGLRSYLPDGVRLRDDLTVEQRRLIEGELNSAGIFPMDEHGY